MFDTLIKPVSVSAMAMLLAACGSSTSPPQDNQQDEEVLLVNDTMAEDMAPVASSIAPVTDVSIQPAAPITSAIQSQIVTGQIAPPPPPAPPVEYSDAIDEPVQGSTPAAVGVRRETVTTGQICAAALGMLFGRDPSTMTVVSDSASLARVKYMRADDTTWTNECRVNSRSVTWRAIGADGPGRWRTEDEITYISSTAGIAMTVNGETRAFAR